MESSKTDRFELPHRILVNDPAQSCWQFEPHDPHSWARLLGNTLDPYQCPGIKRVTWQFPITTEREMMDHWRWSLAINDPKPYKFTIITNG